MKGNRSTRKKRLYERVNIEPGSQRPQASGHYAIRMPQLFNQEFEIDYHISITGQANGAVYILSAGIIFHGEFYVITAIVHPCVDVAAHTATITVVYTSFSAATTRVFLDTLKYN